MKKLLRFVLAVVYVLSLVGCSNSKKQLCSMSKLLPRQTCLKKHLNGWSGIMS